MNLKKNNYLLPSLFVVFNILLKSLYLTTQPICVDEPFSIYHAQFDFVHLITYLKNYNNPPLFEIILHCWIKLFGISASSVRVLPMLFSSATVFFIYLIGVNFFSKRVAVLSSLLFTLSTLNAWFAHDCRVYSLFVLLSVISIYLFFKLLNLGKTFTALNVLTFTTVKVLLVYGHYFGFFVWAIEFLIICLFFLKSRQVLIKYGISIIFSLAAYSPQLLVLWQRATLSVSNGTWVQPPNGLESIYNMLWRFCNEPVPTVLCILLLVACVAIYFIKRKTEQLNPYSKYTIIWFVVPFLFMFFVSYKVPMFIDRYLLYLSPAFYILLAIGISYLFSSKKIIHLGFISVTTLFLFSFNLNPSKTRENLPTIVEYIKQKKTDKTLVIACGYDFILNFAYYYNRNYFKIKNQTTEYHELELALQKESIYFTNIFTTEISDKIINYENILYLDASADFMSPNNGIKDRLMKEHEFLEKDTYSDIFTIYRFNLKK